MKKLAIIASSAALAAMPVVGVFAADTTTSTDTITVTVNPTCTFATGGDLDKSVSATLSAGEASDDLAGSTFKINCNDAGGWKLNAIADGEGTTKSDLKGATGDNKIATGTTFSGATSAWGMKIGGTGGEVQDGFTTYKAVPTAETKVVQNTSASDEAEITTSYKVYVSGDQAADTYTGKVKYTLSHPAASEAV